MIPHIELSPCPFCGAKGLIDGRVAGTARGRTEKVRWNIVCSGCGARGPVSKGPLEESLDLMRAAGDAWNRREGVR